MGVNKTNFTPLLHDIGMVSEGDTRMVLDRSKIRRQRNKYREIARKEGELQFHLVNGIYIDGKKDAMLTIDRDENGKSYRKTIVEDHHVVVGEPGGYYLTHITTTDGKGKSIAESLFQVLANTDLKEKLAVIGTDGTGSMTGPHSGFI